MNIIVHCCTISSTKIEDLFVKTFRKIQVNLNRVVIFLILGFVPFFNLFRGENYALGFRV